jgi:hypothetical protein
MIVTNRDEGYWHDEGKLLHPLWSSIFYITDDGGPTMIVDQTISSDMMTLDPSPSKRGWRVPTHVNQLLMFNGQLLHGVLPGEPEYVRIGNEFVLVEEPHIDKRSRITLMMNWWTHPLRDRTCVVPAAHDLTPEFINRYGAPFTSTTPNSTLATSSSSSSSSALACVSKDVNEWLVTEADGLHDMYFFDHDGSRERAWLQRSYNDDDNDNENDNDENDNKDDNDDTGDSITLADNAIK